MSLKGAAAGHLRAVSHAARPSRAGKQRRGSATSYPARLPQCPSMASAAAHGGGGAAGETSARRRRASA
eukprot:4023252-Pyramimonas_sp.AAC.1